MKTIYLDSNFMCHLEDAPDRIAIETDMFDGVVDKAIQFYRYIPQNEEWTDEIGRVFHGVFVQATDSEAINRVTMMTHFVDMQNALDILGVSI